MDANTKSCYIVTEDESLKTVYLPDSTPIYIGRSEETNIIDTKCSRNQVRLYANYAEQNVLIQQIGNRACGFNGYKTERNVKFTAYHNDIIEILYGKHIYRIEFNPPPPEKKNKILPKKRSYFECEESDIICEQNSSSCKLLKMDNNYEENVKVSHPLVFPSNLNISNQLWEELPDGLIIYTPPSIQPRMKIAAYDMDGTLIKTKSGLVFPKNRDDWEILYSIIPGKLKKLYADNYKLVIFTNQLNISLGKTKISDFKYKIEKIVHTLEIPVQVFIATTKNIYRKPTLGMWNTLEQHKNGGIPIEKHNSFFVGDAAGRQKNWAPGKKKDHSTVDRLMALNIGLKFETPEEHFLGHKPAPFTLPVFDPKSVIQQKDICHPLGSNLTSSEQEVILMVGSPGTGKSHFVKNYLTSYKCVSRDVLGTWQKCLTATHQYLNEGKSVVIDNTNPDFESRKRFIQAVEKYKIPIRCFVMAVNSEHAKHNNRFRELTNDSHSKINAIVLNTYLKNYVAPTIQEGFSEIIFINFVPKFDNDEHRNLYKMYLLEN